MATAEAPSATEYIVHHLTHLSTAKQKSIVDFSVINVDTVIFSVLCLVGTLLLLRAAAKRASAGVPGRFQVVGTRSPHSMMDTSIATYGEENRLWTGDEARAFARVAAVPSLLAARAANGQR